MANRIHDYDEACETTITAKNARKFIEEHCLSFEDFQVDCGQHETYTGQTVLDWLGY